MSVAVQDLRVDYPDDRGGRRSVLSIRSARFEGPEPVCLVGGSGSGKTTFLNVLAGIVRPAAGRVLHDDVDITALSEAACDRFRASRIGYVFQTFNLLASLSARDNVRIAQSLGGHRGREARQRCDELLTRVGVSARAGARPRALSVGEQQRVAIARAVVNRPRVVLADEPTANLDEANAAAALDLLIETAQEAGALLLLVTHDRQVMDRIPRVIQLRELQS
jgi:ABC-type lipoprotein export system ATPase subunit